MHDLELTPEKTALVVIDLQKGIVGMPAEPIAAGAVVTNAARLAEKFREKSAPVFLVHVTPSPDGGDALQPIADATMNITRSDDWAEIVPEMGPKASDFVITKRQWGAFYGTELDMQLRRRRIDTIVLCGIATSIGVESTARFAYEYGYQQVFVSDAMTDRTQSSHEDALNVAFPRMGRVRTTEEVLGAL